MFPRSDAPKLHIVRHDEFIPAEYLPTFGSHAIEMNIHRVPDLAEHFVYFNDDMFLLRSFQPENLFRDGLPRTYGGEAPIELFLYEDFKYSLRCMSCCETRFADPRAGARICESNVGPKGIPFDFQAELYCDTA